MEQELAAIKRLLYVVLVLSLLMIGSNIFVGLRMAENSRNLENIYNFLEEKLFGEALQRADAISKKLESAQQAADSMDAKMRAAQNEFIERMRTELPKIMDQYIEQRAAKVERQIRSGKIPMTLPKQ